MDSGDLLRLRLELGHVLYALRRAVTMHAEPPVKEKLQSMLMQAEWAMSKCNPPSPDRRQRPDADWF